MNWYKIQIQLISLFAHVAGIFGIIALFYTGEWSWLIWSALIGYTIAFSVECGWHRLTSHRSYQTSKFWERLMGFIGTYNGEGSPLKWAAIHRQHHIHSDQDDNDPYPFHIGLWRMWTLQHNEPKMDRRVLKSIARDWAFKDKFFQFLDKSWLDIHIATFCILNLFGWEAVVYLYALPVLLNHIATVVVVNWVGHWKGHFGSYRPYKTKDNSVNTPWIHFPWLSPAVNHNTHHGNAGAWDITGEKWWEFDIYSKFIRLIKYKS